MRCLLDSDILAYEYGSLKQLEAPEKPLEWEITRSLVDDRIKEIVAHTGSESVSAYLTDSKSNFRNKVATILPYKGRRKEEKPYHWERIRQHLIDNYDAEVQYGIEADDRLGIEQSGDFFAAKKEAEDIGLDNPIYSTIICSRDKDLDMIPGWHYSWPCGNQKERMFFQDETTAIRHFYRQLLTGDRSTDNILGLYGVGANSRLVKVLEGYNTELDMFWHVFKAYEDRFGSYAYDFLLENAQLLWIKREDCEDFIHHPEWEIWSRFQDIIETNEKEEV